MTSNHVVGSKQVGTEIASKQCRSTKRDIEVGSRQVDTEIASK